MKRKYAQRDIVIPVLWKMRENVQCAHFLSLYNVSDSSLIQTWSERPKESDGTREGRGKLGEASSGAHSQGVD